MTQVLRTPTTDGAVAQHVPADSGARLTPRTRRTVWLSSFCLFAVMASCWAMASPLFASPDETSHVVKAAAVVRGEFRGDLTPTPLGGPGPITYVELPQPFDTVHAIPCHAFQPDVTPNQCPAFASPTHDPVRAGTYAGQYNPTYYLLVGWPSLAFPSSTGVILMRILSGLVSAALLAGAVLSLAEISRSRLAVMGAAAATTPMVLFLAGTVNPSGVEVTAGIAVWAALLAMVKSPDPELLNRRMVRLGVAGTLLLNVRMLGPLWMFLIIAGVLLVTPWPTLKAIVRERSAWICGGALAAASLAAAMWTLTTPTVAGTGTSAHPELTFRVALAQVLTWTPTWINEQIGRFGWLDTSPAVLTYLVWHVVIGFLAIAALLIGSRRDVVLIFALLLSFVAVPVVLQATQADEVGWAWQGRYQLPISVGLPILAAVLLAGCRVISREVALRGAWVVGSVLALGHLLAFVWFGHRYGMGAAAPWFPGGEPWILRATWAPPGSWPMLLLVYGIACVAIPVLMSALVRHEGSAGHPVFARDPTKRS